MSAPSTGNGAQLLRPPESLDRCEALAVLCSPHLLTAPVLTSTGGLFYDVHGISRTGTPRGHAKGGVPVFGGAPVKSTRRAANAKRCAAALATSTCHNTRFHCVSPTPPLSSPRTTGASRARSEDTVRETASSWCRARARRVTRRGGGCQSLARPTRRKISLEWTCQKCTRGKQCGRARRVPCEARSGQAATPSQVALGSRLYQAGRAAAAALLAMLTARTLAPQARWRAR